jgi:ribosome biogenesis GTPase A
MPKRECIHFQVIEVHDGRIPLSGRYVRFGGHITGHRPHILVLNKKDLVNFSPAKIFGKPRR